MNSKVKVLLSLFICISIFSGNAWSFSDQTTAERIIRENKEFIEFVNKGITNFASNKKDALLEVYDLHFNADVAYLQSDYRRAYKRIYASQGKMEKLYVDLLKAYYLEDSKNILDKIAPGIIRSKNARARLYLTLGYRDRTVSWTHYTVGVASNPRLHSYKLYKYVDAIKMARRAKRYGFLALFESQKDQDKQKIYNLLMKSEMAQKNKFYNRFIDKEDREIIAELEKDYYDYKRPATVETQSPVESTFEKQLSKRVRYRNENKVGRYLLNTEFDKAEDIMRKYVRDFNFKLISATFDYLSISNKPAVAGALGTIDYQSLKVHLQDNYQRFANPSVLDDLQTKVKVEDDIQKKKESEEKDLDRIEENKDKKDSLEVPAETKENTK